MQVTANSTLSKVNVRGSPARIQSAKARYTVNKGEAQTAKNRNGHADWNLGTGLEIGRFDKGIQSECSD